MKRDIAAKLMADLRANPPQARGALFDGRGHCCLGRLCVLYGSEPRHIKKSGDYEFFGEAFKLPDEVIKWAGMKSNDGKFWDDVELATLVGANDSGKTFAEIADIIAAHVDEL